MTRLEKAIEICRDPEILKKILTQNTICPGDIIPGTPDGRFGDCPTDCEACWNASFDEDEER